MTLRTMADVLTALGQELHVSSHPIGAAMPVGVEQDMKYRDWHRATAPKYRPLIAREPVQAGFEPLAA